MALPALMHALAMPSYSLLSVKVVFQKSAIFRSYGVEKSIIPNEVLFLLVKCYSKLSAHCYYVGVYFLPVEI